jgi:hypothetical protein
MSVQVNFLTWIMFSRCRFPPGCLVIFRSRRPGWWHSSQWTRPTFTSDPSVSQDDIEEFDDNLITESIFDDEWESDLLLKFTRDTISSQSLDNETDSED